MDKIMMTIFLGIVLVAFPGKGFGEEELDENALFQDSQTVIQSGGLLNKSIATDMEKKSVHVTGSLYSTSTYTTRRKNFPLKEEMPLLLSMMGSDSDTIRESSDIYSVYSTVDDDSLFLTDMTGNFLLDIRLTQGVKGLVNLDAYYYPQGKTEYTLLTDVSTGASRFVQEEVTSDHRVKEAFVDANLNRRVFFRMGKQVLQWGRGYFFNPTDLINIEKKDFLDMTANREGVYGLKAHIPFGAKYNVYGFLDTGDKTDTDAFAWAGKFEFLLKNTEMAFSGWTRKGRQPVYGFDFSSRISQVDVFGELSLTPHESIKKLRNDFSVTEEKKSWVPRVSLGMMKTFDVFDVTDRVLLVCEAYHNQAGYSENVFEGFGKTAAILANGLYEPNTLSTYYAAAFFSFNDFFTKELTFLTNAIVNLTDHSAIVLSGLRYQPVYDFTVELTASRFMGKDHAEYTFWGNEASLKLVIKIEF